MLKTKSPKSYPYILLIVLVLVASGILIYKKFKYKFVQSKLEQAVDKKSKGIYQLAYDHLVIDEVAGSISAENIRLIPDTAAYRSLLPGGKQPAVLLDITIPRLVISGIKTPKAVLTKEIEAHRMVLSDVLIRIGVNNYFRDTSNYDVGRELYKQLLGNLKSIRMDSIILEHASIVISDLTTRKVHFKGSDFSLFLDRLDIDSASQQDPDRIFFAREVGFSCASLKLPSADHQYEYHFKELEYSSAAGNFQVKRIEVLPQLSETAFANASKFSRDRYDFILEGIRVNIDRQAMLHKRLLADSMIIRQSSFKIFRDISHPHDSLSRVGTYPQQQLQKLDLPVNVRHLILDHSFVEYKERNNRSDSSGKVQFWAVHAGFTNLTNMPAEIKKNKKATLDFRSLFLNKAAFHAILTMYLGDPDGRFDLNADMGSMNATVLNPMIQPMALARVDKGKIEKLHFQLAADNRRSDGSLLFLYHDLKVTLLKKDNEDNTYRKKVLPTLAAALLVKDSNPANGKTRTSSVHYDRDIYRSMFNLMWKSLFTGVKETVGVKKD
jgi:hypothetical protein